MKETWKDIPGYEGLYQVSDLGRVRSLDRDVKDSRWGRQRRKGRVLKPGQNEKGYLLVVLSKNGKTKSKKIHQLVAIAFMNHNPSGHKIVVDHIDNDNQNNKLSNLQLITSRENSSKDKSGSSQYTGVSWEKQTKKWRAVIYLDGKSKKLGRFQSEYDAHLAYQNELEKISA